MSAARTKAPLRARLHWTATFVALLALIALLLLGARTSSAAPPSAASAAHPAFEDEEELKEIEEEEREEREEEEREEEEREEEEFDPKEEPGAEEEEPNWDALWEARGWKEEELGGTDCELGHEALADGLLTLTDVEDLCAAEKEWEAELEGHRQKGRGARPSCALRSARARVATRRNRLVLRIAYAVATPTRARIEVRAGKRKLATVNRRLGGRGVIRLNRRVGRRLGKQLSKRQRGKRVRIRIKPPKRAAACPSRRLALFAR